MLGLIYLSLLLHIWQDTQMKPALVAQGYASMETLELADHTHKYLPYYVIYLFAIPTGLFMLTSFPEKVKRVLAVLPFVLIGIDVTSMWLIPYLSKMLFAWVLWFAGSFLSMTFFVLFVLNLYDVWLRKNTASVQ